MYLRIVAVTATVTLATLTLLFATGPASAAVIASDDFESYELGSILDQGAIGSGWDSAYSGLAATKTATISERNVAEVMPGFGQSLDLWFSAVGTNVTNNNMVQRLFTPQYGNTVYVGFAFKTAGFEFDEGIAGDMFQLYVNHLSNDTGTGGSQGDSLSCGVDYTHGTPEDPSGEGGYFVRKSGDQTATSFLHTDGVVHRIVMRVAVEDVVAACYDQVAVFVDQDTEGTPDALRDWDETTNPTTLTPEISRLHLRLWGLEVDDHVYIDSLCIATTYAEALPVLPDLPLIPGDTDGNMVVNEVDAAVLAANWGVNVGTGGYASGDFNGDTLVNAADAAIQAANWGNHTGLESASTVPEPGTIALLLSLVLVVLPRRTGR